jgi:nitroimidazol reductase NimA-like FMN-containing flavoprotein (pyridoxamine 5'-phosphate oxidase superfamily)
MLRVRNVTERRVTFEVVLGHLRKRDFAVLSTVDKEGTPHAVGVNYGVSRLSRDLVLYISRRRGTSRRSACLAGPARSG